MNSSCLHLDKSFQDVNNIDVMVSSSELPSNELLLDEVTFGDLQVSDNSSKFGKYKP